MIDPAALRDLFDRAASLPPADRVSFLAGACGGNEPLRQEVERLLAADGRLGSVFESHDQSQPSSADAADASRTLAPGTALGPYVIDALVGAGGMGEVYRAHDTRLRRAVAIKVLPAALTQDPTSRHRFEREAHAAAALAHPHICTLLDIGRQGDTDFLVMEFLSGETVATRLVRGRLPLEDSLTSGIEIADALASAHHAGIVHRDLKPGNIMLTPSGVKLLDFGLARLDPATAFDSATVTVPEPLTSTGTILGTVQYMAPEQLEGRQTDARTDIFAFGMVLYEMVSGRRAFDGASHAALIGNILRAEPPPLSSSARITPAALDRLTRKCLAKDPGDRWASMTEVRERLAALRDVLRDGSGPVAAGPPKRPRFTVPMLVGAALLVTVGGSAIAWWIHRLPAMPQATTAVVTGQSAVERTLRRITFERGLQTDPSFSPDGRMLAYSSDRNGNFDIYVQPLAGGDPIQVTKSPAHDTAPSWSPDGNTLAFRSERDGGGLYLVPALGGAERRVSLRGTHPVWSPDGSEVQYLIEPIGNNPPIFRAVNINSGATRDVYEVFQKSGWWKWIAPRTDGRISFLGSRDKGRSFFTVSDRGVVESDVSAVRATLDTAYGRQSSIFSEVRFEWSRDGTELLLETRSTDGIRNLWNVHVDPTTLSWTRMERLTTGSGSFRAGTFSPDGRHVAFSLQQESEPLWEYKISSTGLTDGRAVTDTDASVLGAEIGRNATAILFQLLRPGSTAAPRFWIIRNGQAASEVAGFEGLPWVSISPDGRQVAYLKPRTGQDGRVEASALAIHEFNGSDRLVGSWGPIFETPSDWPDSDSVVTGGLQLKIKSIKGTSARDETRVLLTPKEGNLWEAKYSPNGRWLAFVNSQRRSSPDHSEVSVVPRDPTPQTAWVRIAADLMWADKPRWSPDGKALYFLGHDGGSFLNVWRVSFDDVHGVPVGAPVRLSTFDSPSFALSRSASMTGWGVSNRKAWLTMTKTLGNIWVLDNVDR